MIDTQSTKGEDDSLVDSGNHEDNLLDDSTKVSYSSTPYRFVILLFFFMLTVTISSIQTSLTPAASNIAIAYDVHVLLVVSTSIVFMITYVPMTFVAIYCFNHMKPSLVFRIASANAIFGGWIRILSDGFNPILTGFILISLSYPIMLSAVTLICN